MTEAQIDFSSSLSSLQQRILALLGNGVSAEMVANTVGVTPSYVSQLVSSPDFAEHVSLLRYENLSKHNVRDANYDELEDTLTSKLQDFLPLMTKPLEILRAIQVINGAKRRGSTTPENITNKQVQINLIMPTTIVQKFTTNVNNQITAVAGQELLTIDSKALLAKLDTGIEKGIGTNNDKRTERQIERTST